MATSDLISTAKKEPGIFLCILGISWFWLVGATFLAEFNVFAKSILNGNEHIVTFFLILFAIGLALGSLFCNRLLKGKIHATYVPLGAIGMTLFIFDLYFATRHYLPPTQMMSLSQFLKTFLGWRISVDLSLIAICGGIFTVPLYAILQYRSDSAHRARIIAANNIMNALFMVCAAIGTLILLKLQFTVTQVFLVIGILNAIVAIYITKLLPYFLVKNFFRWVLTSLYRVKVKGLENLEQAGNRVILVPNHTSFIDALLLATFLPTKLSFAINTHVTTKWWIKLFIRLVKTYPVDPTNPMAIKSLIEFVQTNKRLVIFPEGRLTMTGALMKVYEGPGLIADKAGAKLLPVRIEGAQYTIFSRLKGKVRIQWMPNITITVLPAQNFNIPLDSKGKARRHLISQQLYDLMTNMIFESTDYNKTLFTALLDARASHGGRHEIMEDIERTPVSYKKFITHAYILGSVIAKSTHAGEAVGVLLPNTTTTVTTFFALQAFCRVPAMLNYSAGKDSVVNACRTAVIKIVYTSHKFIRLANLSEMVDALEQAHVRVVYLEDLRPKVGLFTKLLGLLRGNFPKLAYQAINAKANSEHLSANATAVILFTSGSEGSPKGVVLSHKNILANCAQLSACVDFTSSDQIFNALPIFHSFGLTGGLLLPILNGMKVFLYPSPLHYRIVPELAYDTDASILFGTDTFLAGYAKYAHPYDFYSIRYVFAGAEKLREETRLIWAQKFGVRIFEGYGATEAAPVIATNTPMQNKVGSVGRLLPGIQHQIKTVAGINTGGELIISGPNVMKGYLRLEQPGILMPPFNGWYETGDIVTLDDLGYVTIQGRVKRFAKIAGEMVSLIMVEQYLSQLWPDYQHAVINAPDPKKGEQLILVTTHPEAKRDDIVAFAKNKGFAEITLPKKIIYTTIMPLLGSGKTDYSGVKKLVPEAI